MKNVFGITQPPEETRPEELEERKAFCEYVESVMKLYRDGKIDVVAFGFVDAAGIPYPDLAPFHDGLANDALALGYSLRSECKERCHAAHDRVKSSG